MRRKKGDGSVFQRGAVWWVKYYRNGKPYRESSGSDKESDARKLLKKRAGEIAVSRFIGPEAERVTIRELAQDYLNDYRVNGRKSLDKAERMVTRHDDDGGNEKDSVLMAYFGDCKAHNVGTDAVKKYISQRLEAGAANASINRELAALKRMYSLGIQAEKVYRKPYIPMLKENNVRTGFFEYGEFVAVRSACPEWFRPVVTFAYFIPWRKENILKLRWNQVDLQAKEIRLEVGTTKNDEGVVIALDGELLETLKAQWERRKVVQLPGRSPALLSPHVFHRNGKVIGGKRGDIRDVWHNACIKVGLGQMIEVERKGKKVKVYRGKLFHDFRRTGCRDIVRSGTHERVAMQISGHKTRSIFDRYNIVSPQDLREAARRRQEYADNQEKMAKVAALRETGSEN